MSGDDPRWLAFGFEMPSTPTTPAKPVNVFAHMDENGAVIVTCDAEAFATRYRFRRMIVGVETSYVLAASSKEPIGSFSDVLPGQTVQIIAQTVNGSLQSVASDPIQFTIPLPLAKSEAPKRQTNGARDESVAVSTNGHTNGNRRLPAPRS